MINEAVDHVKEDFILLLGTKVHEMLGEGIATPPKISLPELAQILMDYYKIEKG